MITISRDYWFSASHQIEGHPKCGRCHGHNYKVTVAVTGEPVSRGMVMDFSELDDICKPIIDGLDHYYIASHDNVSHGNPVTKLLLELGQAVSPGIEYSTAESLCKYIAYATRLPNVQVTVWETHKSMAHFALQDDED